MLRALGCGGRVRLACATAVVVGTTAAAAVVMMLADAPWSPFGRRGRFRRARWRRRELMAAMKREPTEALKRMLTGELYNANDPTTFELHALARVLCHELNTVGAEDPACKLGILRELVGSVDADRPPFVEPPFYCDYGFNITLGHDFYANCGCVLLDCNKITIGNNVFLAPDVHIYSAGHPLDAEERRVLEYAKPVVIGDDVWVGGGAKILPGVTIGDRVVVAAGAVVTRDVPSDSLVSGIPARVTKTLPRKRAPASAAAFSG